MVTAAVGVFALYTVAWDIGRPFFEDEVETAYAVETILRTSVPLRIFAGAADWIPPLYFYSIVPSTFLLGFSPVSVRLPGVLCLILTCVVLGYLVRFLIPRAGRAAAFLLTVVVLVSSPAVVQGCMIAEADTTLLSLGSVLLVTLFARECDAGKGSRAVAGMFVLTLLVKPTTTLAFIPCYTWAYVQNHGFRNGLRRSILFVLGSSAAFLGAMVLISLLMHTDPLAPFRHIVGKLGAVRSESSPLPAGVVKTFVESYFWFTPFWWLLCGGLFIEGVRTAVLARGRLDVRFHLFLYATLIMGVYFVAGGTTFGYPRYFYPALPVFAILFGVWCADVLRWMRTESWIMMGAVWSACVLMFVMTCGDPLRTLSVDLRSDLVFTGTASPGTLMRLMLSAGIPMIAGIIGWLGVWRLQRGDAVKAFKVSVLCGLVVMNCMMTAFQARARYATGYNYGAEGTEAVLALINPDVDHFRKKLLAPIGVTYMVRGDCYIRGSTFWEDPDALLNFLREKNIEYLVLGLRVNTVSALRGVFQHPALRRYLREEYDFQTIGNYYIWTRHSSSGPLYNGPRAVSPSISGPTECALGDGSS